jgi:plasmid stabilization system protein ParE
MRLRVSRLALNDLDQIHDYTFALHKILRHVVRPVHGAMEDAADFDPFTLSYLNTSRPA